MKTILIATDFSLASRNASIYGVQLAKAIGANIILFHAYKPPTPASGLGVSVSRYAVMMQTNKRLLEEAQLLDPGGNMVDILGDEGSTGQAILNLAEEKKVEYIISGMKGSGKSLKKLVGSTATLLAKKTTIPLIIVPEDAKFTIPGVLVFATDALEKAQGIPEELIQFARYFNFKLYIVKVFKSKNEEWFEVAGNMGTPKKPVQIVDTAYQFPLDKDIQHALSEFNKTHNADILVMIPHKHEWLERLYRTSNTAEMILHTKIPLLILPELKTDIQKPGNTVAKPEYSQN